MMLLASEFTGNTLTTMGAESMSQKQRSFEGAEIEAINAVV